MKISEIETLEQFREKKPESTSTDEQVTNYFFEEKSSRKQTNDNYYDFVKKFDSKSPIVSLKNLDNADLSSYGNGYFKNNNTNEKDNIQKTNDVYEYIKDKDKNFNPEFKSFLNTYDQRTSRQPVPDSAPMDIFMPIGWEEVAEPYNEFEIAKSFEVGVNPNGDVTDVRKAQSFAENEKQGMKYLSTALDEVFGEKITTRTGPKTGSLEFFNPVKNQWSLLNPEGIDLSDFSRFAGDALVVIPDIIASSLAAIYSPGGGKTKIAAASATSGFTVAAADALRLGIGDYMYGSQTAEGAINVTKEKYGEEWFNQFAAVLTAGGFSFVPVVKWAANSVAKASNKVLNTKFKTSADPVEAFSEQEIKNLYTNNKYTEEAMETLAKYRVASAKMNMKNKLTFTIAESADSFELLAKQHGYELNEAYGVRGTFDIFNKARAENLRDFIINSEKSFHKKSAYDKRNSVDAEELSTFIKKIIGKAHAPLRKEALDAETKAGKKLTNEFLKLPSGQEKPLGQTIRNTFETIDDTLLKGFEKSYSSLFKAGGARTINTDGILKSIAGIKGKQALSKVRSKDLEAFLKVEDFQKGTMTMNEVKETLSSLLKIERFIKKGGPEEIAGFPSSIIKALNKQMKKDLGVDDQFYKDYLKIGKEYKYYKEHISSVMNRVMKIDPATGALKIGDEEVFKQTFLKNNQQSIDQVYNILKEKPSYLNNYKKNIENFYKDFVDPTRSGKPDLAKHAKFIKDYGYAVKKFYGADKNKFDTIADLTKTFEKNVANNTKLAKDLKATTLGKLENLDPDLIVGKIYKGDTIQTLRTVVNEVKKQPAVLKRLQTVVAQNLRNDSLDPMTDLIDFKLFVKNYNQQKKKLQIVFADQPQYLSNLETFKDSLKIMYRSQKAKGGTKAKLSVPVVIDTFIITRIAPPLTARGRLYEGLKKGFGLKTHDQMTEILLDPDLLSTFNKMVALGEKAGPKGLKKLNPRDMETFKKYVNILFGSYLKDKDIFNLGPYPENNVEENIKLYRDMEGKDFYEGASNKLSQEPINVATSENKAPVNQAMAMAPSQGPVNPQGIAALSTDQGPRATGSTNVATVDKMKDYGMEFLA